MLVKASEKMQPLGSADAAVAESDNHVSSQNSSAVSDKSGATERVIRNNRNRMRKALALTKQPAMTGSWQESSCLRNS